MTGHNIDVGVVTETWFTPSHPVECTNIEGYTLFSRGRTPSSRGRALPFMYEKYTRRNY